MRTVTAISAVALLALSTAAFAQNSDTKAMQQNAAPAGAEKQSGAANTESGPAKGTEGRASATDKNNSAGGATPKMQYATPCGRDHLSSVNNSDGSGILPNPQAALFANSAR